MSKRDDLILALEECEKDWVVSLVQDFLDEVEANVKDVVEDIENYETATALSTLKDIERDLY